MNGTTNLYISSPSKRRKSNKFVLLKIESLSYPCKHNEKEKMKKNILKFVTLLYPNKKLAMTFPVCMKIIQTLARQKANRMSYPMYPI